MFLGMADFWGHLQAIDKSEPATLPSKRIQNIIDHLTYEIYLYIQRGLFERHKLLFALMLTNRVMQSAGSIRGADVDVFLKGGGALDITSVRKKPKEWIPDSVWLSIIALSQMDAFRDIPDSVFRNDGLWKQWCGPLLSYTRRPARVAPGSRMQCTHLFDPYCFLGVRIYVHRCIVCDVAHLCVPPHKAHH